MHTKRHSSHHSIPSLLPALCFGLLVVWLDTPHLTGGVISPDSVCGDGSRHFYYESCDDGNKTSGDGCSKYCNIEQGYTCTAEVDVKSICEFNCGNGRGDDTEHCDDGNRTAGDGCNSKCRIEKGYECIMEYIDLPSQCFIACGNGKIDYGNYSLGRPGEQCDDGNQTSGDGCNSKCRTERGFLCVQDDPEEPTVCGRPCGNGSLNSGERCDDGNTASGDGCSKKCNVERGFVCIQDNPEEPSYCERPCGNAEYNAGEKCDDGNTASGDGCSAKCKVEKGFICTWEDLSGPSDCNPKS